MKIVLAVLFNIFNIIWMIAYYPEFRDDWSLVTNTKPEFAIVPFIIFAIIVSTLIILGKRKDPNRPVLPFWSALSSRDPEEMGRTMDNILEKRKEKEWNTSQASTSSFLQ